MQTLSITVTVLIWYLKYNQAWKDSYIYIYTTNQPFSLYNSHPRDHLSPRNIHKDEIWNLFLTTCDLSTNITSQLEFHPSHICFWTENEDTFHNVICGCESLLPVPFSVGYRDTRPKPVTIRSKQSHASEQSGSGRGWQWAKNHLLFRLLSSPAEVAKTCCFDHAPCYSVPLQNTSSRRQRRLPAGLLSAASSYGSVQEPYNSFVFNGFKSC